LNPNPAWKLKGTPVYPGRERACYNLIHANEEV
jgi:hypothetical protein